MKVGSHNNPPNLLHDAQGSTHSYIQLQEAPALPAQLNSVVLLVYGCATNLLTSPVWPVQLVQVDVLAL
jgi:hypothetical protein